MKFLWMFVILLFLAFQCLAQFFTPSKRSEISLSCSFIPNIEQSYLRQHVLYDKLTGELKKRAAEQYIKRLDPLKVYFDQKDVKKIRKLMKDFYVSRSGTNCGQYMKNCMDSVRSCVARKQACLERVRRCDSLDEIRKLYLNRVAKRLENAQKVLNKKFKLNKKTAIQIDADQRKHPANQAEANRFQVKYLQFQVANFMVIDKSVEKAKGRVLRNHERNYRRLKEMGEDEILSGYLDAYATALDPHSRFFSKDVLEDFEISMKLSLQGIGATLRFDDGFTVIEQLLPGGAAYRQGRLKEKDKIISVGQGGDGEMLSVIEQNLRDVVRKIRGPKGTTVRLGILRKADEGTESFEVSIVRDEIKLEDEAVSVDYIERTRKGKKQTVALVNLPSFYSDSRDGGRSSAKDLKKQLKNVNKKNVDAMVLDLSTNGGGSLEDAVKIAGFFFKKGNVVKQSSRARIGHQAILKDKDPDIYYTGPLVVLTSRVSASASEIVAGTLKDYQRAVIVGNDQTFGKGSIQSVNPISREIGALKITVGMFFVPGGYSTQHRGVISDIKVPSIYEAEDMGEDHLDYSLPPKKLASFLSKDAYVTDGVGHWDRITSNIIKGLKEKSRKRVATNKDFKEIIKEIKEVKNKKKKKILLSDILNENKKNSKKDDEDNEEGLTYKQRKAKTKDRYLKRADINEAIEVALDLAAA